MKRKIMTALGYLLCFAVLAAAIFILPIINHLVPLEKNKTRMVADREVSPTPTPEPESYSELEKYMHPDSNAQAYKPDYDLLLRIAAYIGNIEYSPEYDTDLLLEALDGHVYYDTDENLLYVTDARLFNCYEDYETGAIEYDMTDTVQFNLCMEYEPGSTETKLFYYRYKPSMGYDFYNMVYAHDELVNTIEQARSFEYEDYWAEPGDENGLSTGNNVVDYLMTQYLAALASEYHYDYYGGIDYIRMEEVADLILNGAYGVGYDGDEIRVTFRTGEDYFRVWIDPENMWFTGFASTI